MNQQKLEKLRQNHYRDLRMLRMIEQGLGSQTEIAKKLGLDRRYVDYYFKILKIKVK